MNLAVFGLGPWGLTYLNALAGAGDGSPGVVAICDPDPGARALAAARAPAVQVFAREAEALAWIGERPSAGIVVATPIATHASLAARALTAGIGVLVEKPLAASWVDADRLARMPNADALGAVGHLLLHHPAVQALGTSIRQGRLGRLRRVSALRTSQRTGVLTGEGTPEIWHLAPHDVAMVIELVGGVPDAVRTVREGEVLRVDLAFATAEATLRLARGRAVGERSLVVEGDAETARFDELRGALQISDGFEGVFHADVLRLQCQAFVRQLRDGAAPEVSFRSGRDVVGCLEAAEASLANGGGWMAPGTGADASGTRGFSRKPEEETRRAG